MAKEEKIVVRLERQPHRDAIERVRKAYRQLRKVDQVQEAEDDKDSGIVCTGIDAQPGEGSDN